jgi:predicted amidohydrolase
MASRLVELVAVQAFMRLEDYLDAAAFDAKIAGLGAAVAAALSFADYGSLVRPGDDTAAVLRRRVLARPAGVLATMLRHTTPSPTAAVLLAESPKMHRIYYDAFSALARRLAATVVAGSIILPENARGPGARELRPRDRRLYNLAYTFAPDGRCVMVTKKVHLVPTQEDVLPLSPGTIDELHPIASDCGTIGVMICYDGFAEPHTHGEPAFRPLGALLAARGVEIIAQPSANPWPWNERWIFCDAGEDQLRRDQWLAEGLMRQLPAMAGVRYAVNPQLIGDILGNRFDGRSYVFARSAAGTVQIVAEARHDALAPSSEEIVVARVPAAGIGAGERAVS